jgi:peptidoglycan/xylan/chitin deacetylase (PgdA/CDA1 family)
MTFTTLAFHAEKLHQPRVWRRVAVVARWMAAHGIHATFFVYPFPAMVHGKNINDRVRWLGSLGHEIAQHTHFYAGTRIEKRNKVDDLSKENIIHCVRRDFAALSTSGYSPKGFTAGSWFVSDTVLDVLVELGFVYDCSAQIPKPRNPTPDPRMQWLRLPQNYRNGRGKLLCLPTTCSLGEWFKWGWKTAREQTHWHQIVYLHDYDLLSFHRRLMLLCFLRITHRETFEPTSMAVQQYRVHGGLAQCP